MQDTSALEKPFDVATFTNETASLLPPIDLGGQETPYAKSRRQDLRRNLKDHRTPIGDSEEMAKAEPEAAGQENAGEAGTSKVDYVNHPPHYTKHPSGIECIEITRWMNFNLGNAMKYIWRCNDKGSTIEDLKKAQWYIADEIAKLEKLVKSA